MEQNGDRLQRKFSGGICFRDFFSQFLFYEKNITNIIYGLFHTLMVYSFTKRKEKNIYI